MKEIKKQIICLGDTVKGDADKRVQNNILSTQIDLQDIMTLVEKLGESGRQTFLQSLSQQENLSENVFNLLLKHIDSKILFNLCNNATVSGNILDVLVQKIIGITQNTENIPLVQEIDEEYYPEEDEELVISVIKNPSPYIECLLKNTNLQSSHIENIMMVFQGSMSHRFQVNICENLSTPSWILEKMYEMNPNNLKDVVFANPNLSELYRGKIQTIKNQNREKNKINQHIERIVQKHPGLDIYQILEYYENKKDNEVSSLIAEYLYNDNLGGYRYGSKIDYEKLQFKLQLVQKYAMSEERKLRILCDLIGENIVDSGSLEIYEKYDDKPICLSIQEAEDKFGVKITQEHIKVICQDIFKEMLGRTTPQFKDIENVYTFAQNMNIEIPDINRQYYIKAMRSFINNRKSNLLAIDEVSEYFKKLLQLVVENKKMFSISQLESYVKDMNTLGFPTGGVHDIFAVIAKLELSNEFIHDMVIKQLKECLKYDHNKGKLLMQRFGISNKELVQIIIDLQEKTPGDLEIGGCGWCFAIDGNYSLEECLHKYGIPHDEVIPYMIDDIKRELIDNIQKKDYDRARNIIDKYNIWVNGVFDEQIEVLNMLTKK